MIEGGSHSSAADAKPCSDRERLGLSYAIAISLALPLLAVVATDQFDAILFFFALLLPAMLITAIFASRPAVLSGGVLAWAVIIAMFAVWCSSLGERTIAYSLLFFFAWSPATIIAPALALVFTPRIAGESAWRAFVCAGSITVIVFALLIVSLSLVFR